MHTVRAGITAAMEFFIEVRIAVGTDKNTCLFRNSKYFIKRRKVDTAVRQNGFHHVDIVVGNES